MLKLCRCQLRLRPHIYPSIRHKMPQAYWDITKQHGMTTVRRCGDSPLNASTVSSNPGCSGVRSPKP